MLGAEPIFIDRQSEVGVLLLHGFTSSPHQFRELADHLASKGLTVYAPVIAGHGTTPADLLATTINDWKNSVAAAYQKLAAVTQRQFIIGNSFGGNLGLYLAKDRTSIIGLISLGTPIFLRFQILIKLRIYTYGWLKKYYRKPRRVYQIDYTDRSDEVTYPLIPVRALKNFLRFIQDETKPSLSLIKTPTLIMQASIDPVVHPKSAPYLHEHLGAECKQIFWFDSDRHTLIDDHRRQELFERMDRFIDHISHGLFF